MARTRIVAECGKVEVERIFMNTHQMAAWLGVSVDYVRDHIASGELKGYALNKNADGGNAPGRKIILLEINEVVDAIKRNVIRPKNNQCLK